uniref:Uncharacterized protein n=1 Tax=viral metagenome TaxID=1070528 RepID=A0A6C0IW14_9ZZZZ
MKLFNVSQSNLLNITKNIIILLKLYVILCEINCLIIIRQIIFSKLYYK